jgi:hypothetical protein
MTLFDIGYVYRISAMCLILGSTRVSWFGCSWILVLRLSYKSKIIAVITPWGVYQILGCAFGISTALGEYQAQMAHVVLEEFYLKGCIVYIDDTVIHGADLESFLSDQALGRMISYNVRLKPSKCYFGLEEIEFLGHIFTAKGMRLSNARV